MAHMRDGFEVVRVFALAQDFLPQPTPLRRNIERLVGVSRSAKDAGLRIVPTLMVLNMSGRIWWPAWMLDTHGRPADLFADPGVSARGAPGGDVCVCARGRRGDSRVRSANEIDDAQRHARERTGAAGVDAGGCDQARRSGTPIQIGAHLPSLTTQNNMRVDDLAAVSTRTSCTRIRSTPTLRAPFSIRSSLVLLRADHRALGRGRPTLMQEFGLCTAPPERRVTRSSTTSWESALAVSGVRG